MVDSKLECLNEGSIVLHGALIFSHVGKIYHRDFNQLLGYLNSTQQSNITLNMNKVTSSDSSGIALVLEIIRLITNHKKTLQIINIPEQMLALATLSSVEDLLN